MDASFSKTLADAAILLPAFLAALSFHEFFHALAATLLGDPTPKRLGRLTINPIAHIDWMGLLFLFLFKIGWAKPVIFDNRNFKYPRLYSIITAFAGPLANFILALISMYVLKYLPSLGLSPVAMLTFIQIFQALTYVNIMLGVFNILPIPPLDGSHVLMVFLVDKYPHIINWFYRYSIFILLLLFLLPQTRMLFIYLIMFAEAILQSLVI
jgi:Zn-dependent protease